MTAKAPLWADCSQPVKEIIKRLDRITGSGHRPDQVFEDWLDLTQGYLDMIPLHARSIIETGKLATDTPEVAAIWEEKRKRYNPSHRYLGKGKEKKGYFDLLAEASNILLANAEPVQNWNHGGGSADGPDLLGQIYMLFAYPSPGLGQYFTPWDVALLMGQIMCQDAEAMVHDRLLQAAREHQEENPLIMPTILTSLAIPDDHPEVAAEFFHTRVLPLLAPLANPITVCDPAVGSGVMLLAAAAQFPQWAIHWKLVQFYGQDIDTTCVKMARINSILYGFTGHWIKSAAELSLAEIRGMIPAPWQPAYQEAAQAHKNGHNGRVKELSLELHKSKLAGLEQPALF